FMSNKRLKIALVTGGYTKESVINYKSAINVKKHFDKEKFDVYQINIEPNGWYYNDDDTTTKSTMIDRNDFSLTINEKKIKFDCVFMRIAGSPGEDGKLQGYFDMINMPYSGCSRSTSSALTLNKRLAVAVAGFYGINVPKSVCVEKPIDNRSTILQQLELPVFVKPNNSGSSLGANRVETIDELQFALDHAFDEDHQVIVQEAIDGREFTIAVYKLKGKIDTFPITEIIPHNKYYDYAAKYCGQSTEISPAKIHNILENEIRRSATKIYEVMECSCIASVDFIYNEKNEKLYFLEVNTMPGLTDANPLPQQVKAMGLTLTELYTAFIEDALGL
ncbi:unnamed protein product, partial [Didymodactylos carnosus]